ncbi:MAG: hydroxyacylglutathione hydrolase [Piscirickettsiaceae bacterium]|nr:hydroxyacylglutathione hydrolase [Piscirickettsiaceae bacterium]
MLNIHPISAFNDNYIWLIEQPESRRILIVDPGDAIPVIQAIERQRFIPIALLITHHHHDHIDGIDQLVERYNIPVYGPETTTIPSITHPLTTSDTLIVDSDFPAITILDISGHTALHIAYLFDNCLFCGDTLFGAGCGRLLGGTATQLFQSLQQITSLPTQTKIYCAHEYTEANLRFAAIVEPNNLDIQQRITDTSIIRQQDKPSLPSTLALELATNPFLRCEQTTVIQAVEQFSGKQLATPIEVFTELRLWKDQF